MNLFQQKLDVRQESLPERVQSIKYTKSDRQMKKKSVEHFLNEHEHKIERIMLDKYTDRASVMRVYIRESRRRESNRSLHD